MRFPSTVSVVSVVLVATLAAPAGAAHLQRTGGTHKEESYPPGLHHVTPLVQPSGALAATARAFDLTIENPPACEASWAVDVTDILIQPDPGEVVGSPVPVKYCFAARASASSSADGIIALAGVGAAAAPVCQPASLNFSGPITIVINPGGSPVTVFSFPITQVAAGDPPFSVNQCDSFTAKIGDTIEITDSSGTAASSTAVAGSASASASESISLVLAEIPTLSGGGLAALALLVALGAISVLATRRGM